MQKSNHPLETTLREIESAIDAGLYYAALIVALTVPDICAALEDERAYSGREEYKNWYRENLAGRFPYMSDDAAYSLRCGVVHKGNLRLKMKGGESPRVIFTLPGGVTVHNMVIEKSQIGKVLQFDLVQFCEDVIEAARAWYVRKVDDPIVQANLPDLLQLRPRGFGPVVGLPVIA